MQSIRRIFKHALADEDNRLLMASSPIFFMHVAALGALFTGFSWVAVWALAITYVVRVFALTAGFHRYFSHRAFKTSRIFQFIMAWVGTSAAQLGPMWWAANHRHHHLHSDKEEDIHSPVVKNAFWAHIGWVMCRAYGDIQHDRVKDLSKYPELRFIDRFHVLPVLSLVALLYGTGAVLNSYYPGLGTSGLQLVMWGFFLSTVLVYHVTFCVNSVTHIVGKKRFETDDESRNSWWVALLTFGEGWHNNHHRWPLSARQGMYWWELDLSYWLLRMLEKLGLIWDLKVYPKKIYEEAASRPIKAP
ncbi:MAG: acyl-CoA desaturase [Verrucomicrobia bacterium]|jgi:stearoyl-CoA desaturase (delta-9 desaturase)|nr:acyl-CoA desaturase [Verrucomicrobiota bacterium]